MNSQILMITSIDRTTGETNDFHYALDTPVKNVKKVELLSVRIFNSIYNINDNNNLFPLAITDSSDTSNHFTITNGYYTIDELVSELQNAFNARLPTPPTITYDEIRMKIKLEIAASVDPYYFNFQDFTNSPWRELGFLETIYTFQSNATYYPQNIINLGLPLFINISIPELGSNVQFKSINSCTFTIPTNGFRGELITFDKHTLYDQVIHIQKRLNLFNFHVSLVDQNNQLVKLNDVDWGFILKVHFE